MWRFCPAPSFVAVSLSDEPVTCNAGGSCVPFGPVHASAATTTTNVLGLRADKPQHCRTFMCELCMCVMCHAILWALFPPHPCCFPFVFPTSFLWRSFVCVMGCCSCG